MRHLLGFVISVENRAEHRRRTRSNGAVIQINFVFGNKKLFAQFGPVGVFIFVEDACELSIELTPRSDVIGAKMGTYIPRK